MSHVQAQPVNCAREGVCVSAPFFFGFVPYLTVPARLALCQGGVTRRQAVRSSSTLRVGGAASSAAWLVAELVPTSLAPRPRSLAVYGDAGLGMRRARTYERAVWLTGCS